jgi:hypothetical protein
MYTKSRAALFVIHSSKRLEVRISISEVGSLLNIFSQGIFRKYSILTEDIYGKKIFCRNKESVISTNNHDKCPIAMLYIYVKNKFFVYIYISIVRFK